MAVDHALVEARDEGRTRVDTIRLYRFRPACLTLGRGQPAEAVRDRARLAAEGVDVVRRPTGGGAVLHDDDLTYAVVGAEDGRFPGSILGVYHLISEILAEALRSVGARSLAPAPTGRPSSRPASCFAALSPHELGVEGRKLVGSAQLRRRRAFLQHGSILLSADPGRIARALGPEAGSPPIGLDEAAGRRVPEEELVRTLVAAFEARLGPLEAAGLTEAEAVRAAELERRRYRWAASSQ